MYVPALLLTLLTLAELDVVSFWISLYWYASGLKEEQEIRAITTSIHILSH